MVVRGIRPARRIDGGIDAERRGNPPAHLPQIGVAAQLALEAVERPVRVLAGLRGGDVCAAHVSSIAFDLDGGLVGQQLQPDRRGTASPAAPPSIHPSAPAQGRPGVCICQPCGVQRAVRIDRDHRAAGDLDVAGVADPVLTRRIAHDGQQTLPQAGEAVGVVQTGQLGRRAHLEGKPVPTCGLAVDEVGDVRREAEGRAEQSGHGGVDDMCSHVSLQSSTDLDGQTSRELRSGPRFSDICESPASSG